MVKEANSLVENLCRREVQCGIYATWYEGKLLRFRMQNKVTGDRSPVLDILRYGWR